MWTKDKKWLDYSNYSIKVYEIEVKKEWNIKYCLQYNEWPRKQGEWVNNALREQSADLDWNKTTWSSGKEAFLP